MRAVTRSYRPFPASLVAASAGALTLVCLVVLQLHGLDALKAAGITGTAPGQGASAFTSLLNTLQQNALWLVITGMGLGFTIVALMYFVGSMRAPDYLLKIAACIAIILVVGPAVIA